MTKEAKILIGIAAIVLIGGVILSVTANPQPKDPGAPVDSQALIRETSHMTGKKEAKVNVVEFADYQCPACASASPTIKRLIDEYKDNGDVNFVFRHFPLDSIHPNARIGGEAAEAAGEQGKFWEMTALLFEKQAEWSSQPAPIDTLVRYATELGLNPEPFKQSVEQRKYKDIMTTDYQDGTSVGVSSTPTFFVNGQKTDGYQYDELKGKIEEALKK